MNNKVAIDFNFPIGIYDLELNMTIHDNLLIPANKNRVLPEIPKLKTISKQAGSIITGKRITDVYTATSPHNFAFYFGDPAADQKLLIRSQSMSAK